MKKLLLPLLLSLSMLLPQHLVGQDDDYTNDPLDEYTTEEPYVRDTLDGYYFELMDVDITVHADRTYDIVENVDATFLEYRHGLLREIPTSFWANRDVSAAQDGTQYAMRYNGMEIDDIEVSENYEEEDGQDMKVLRIGRGDEWVIGPHHYRIGYRLRLPNDRVEASDLFLHSVVGPGWVCSMDSVHFTIHFDKEIPDSALSRVRVYVGQVGNSENRASDFIDYADSHTIEGSLQELPQLWALTVELPLPEGYFPADDLPIWINLSWCMAIVTLLLLFILIYREVQGDEHVTPVVTFRPHIGMTSADIGSLIDGEVDDVDLLSMIPWFASQGYLSIEHDGKNTLLHKLMNLPQSAPEYQRTLFNGFFAQGNTFDISQTSDRFGGVWQQAKASLKSEYKGKLNTFESKWLLLLATFTLSLTLCWAQAEPNGWVVGGLANVLLAGFMVVVWQARDFWSDHIHFSGCVGIISSLYILGIVGMAVLFGLTLLISIPFAACDDYYIPSSVLSALTLVMLLVIVCQRRLHRMTSYRRERLAEVMGLREFIRTAEEDRLRKLLDQDERYFYNILPYAMAFGMVSTWASKFERLSVKELQEFGNTHVSQISGLLNGRQWHSHVQRSVVSHNASTSGGSHGSASSHRGGYSGGGSGGGGGRSW